MATLEPVKPAKKLSEPQSPRQLPSPAPTAMSFSQGDDEDVLRKADSQRSPSAIDFITREIDRDTPASRGLAKKSSKGDFGKKKSMKGASYYGEIFAIRETGPVVPKSSAVWVELRTNVILENEFEFAKSLSEVIAKRYGKAEDAVCVSIDHSACMIMGGTYEGSYLLTITSLTMISPTCNKRNAALISDWIGNQLGVSVSRGYIRFVDPEFSNYAVGGFTVLDLMEKEELSRTGSTDKAAILREKSTKRSMSRHRSSRKDKTNYEKASFSGANDNESDDVPSELPTSIRGSSDSRTPAAPGHGMKKRSMFDLFTRSRSVR